MNTKTARNSDVNMAVAAMAVLAAACSGRLAAGAAPTGWLATGLGLT